MKNQKLFKDDIYEECIIGIDLSPYGDILVEQDIKRKGDKIEVIKCIVKGGNYNAAERDS